jgi:zinc protease
MVRTFASRTLYGYVYSLMKTLFRSLSILIIGAVFSAHVVQAQAPFKVPEIPVERYKLPNGLTVLLSRDTTAAVVTVDVWYHVGSKNEDVGRTGFAHLFEHVMFQGSKHVPYGQHFKIIENAGGTLNGSTTNDRTNYYQTLPSNQLETALWLESDRMGFLLEGFDHTKLEAQRDVVKNERRQRVDNVPYGSMWEILNSSIFPPSNPYSWPVIGSMADLSAATVDDVTSFFKKYYAPNNATLAVVGDIDIPKTKALIEKYFGPIPSGPPITRPTIPPVTLSAEQRLVLEDTRAQLPQLAFAWPTVGRKNSDNTALQALGNVLTQDRTSRLTKLLVFDRQLASQVSAGQNSYEDGGMFLIMVVPRPEASLTEIERLVDSTLSAMDTNPPTEDEVNRFKNYIRVQSVLRLDGAMRKAEILLDGSVFHDDPLYYVKETNNTLAVTSQAVAQAKAKYLTKGRVVLSMVPAGKLDLIAHPDLPYKNVTPKPEVQIAKPAAGE